jgi:hypothetical protein
MPVPSANLAEAVALACPGAHFKLDPETYAGLTMLDSTPKPTEAEIEAAWANKPVPPPPPIVVTMAALRLALGRDICVLIGSWIGQIADTASKFQAQTWWEFAPTVKRSHPVVEQFRVALGKTTSEVDFWFTKAAQIDSM